MMIKYLDGKKQKEVLFPDKQILTAANVTVWQKTARHVCSLVQGFVTEL